MKKSHILPYWTNFKFDWNSGDEDNDNYDNNNNNNSSNYNKFSLKPIIVLFAEGNKVQLL